MVRSAVTVCVRTRPTPSFAQEQIQIDTESNTVSINLDRSRNGGGYVNNQQAAWTFGCDRVLHNAPQDEVFSVLAKPMVAAALDGYNGTVLAYGQTGAGKTFTMTGATDNYVHRGIIPRAIGSLFKAIAAKPAQAFTVRISYLELYNEHMYDLLAPDDGRAVPGASRGVFGSTAAGSGGPELTIVEDGDGNTHVRGLAHVVATSEEEALNLLFEGDTNRVVGAHSLNKASSRSHTVFTIHIESRSRVESTEKVLVSKLNLVDLAGSERVKKTDSTGITLQEAKYINQSLTFLEQVVVALGDRRPHIPYRQTKLTNVLKDSIGGNCKTLMIANVWPEASQLEETISTLRFASRMMRVSNEPTINVQYDLSALCKKYEADIRQLKEELAMHDALSNRAQIVYDPYTEQERYELNKQVRAYLSGDLDELPVINLRHIRETMAQFKLILNNVEAAALRQLRSYYGSAPPPADAPTTLDVASLVASGGGVGDLDPDGFHLGEFADSAKPANADALKRRPTGKTPRHKMPRKKKLASDRGRKELRATAELSPDASPAPTPSSHHHRHHASGDADDADSPSDARKSRKSSRTSGTTSGRTTPAGAKSRKKKKRRNGSSRDLAGGGDHSPTPPKGASRSAGGDGHHGRSHSPSALPPAALGRHAASGSGPGDDRRTPDSPPSPDSPLAREHGEPESDHGSRLGSDGGGGGAVVEHTFRPTRDDAFAEFKAGPGAQINAILAENKYILRDKRAEMRSAAAAVNEAKAAIDTLRADLDAARQARLDAGPLLAQPADLADVAEPDGTIPEIITEDEAALRLDLQDAKAAYRAAREEYGQAKADHDYLDAHTTECRHRLLADFDAWYDASFATLPVKPPPSAADLAAPTEDVLDDGEKWDLEQTARIAKEDPDAVAFYSARMHVQRKMFQTPRSPGRRGGRH